MKKILICLGMIMCFMGCVDSTGTNVVEPTGHLNVRQYYKDVSTWVFTMEIEGHLYLVYDGYHNGSIIHAEHCPCKNK